MLKFMYEVYPIRARSHIIGVTFVNPWYAIELLNKMPIQTDIIKQAILVLNEISLSFTVIRQQ